jgi:hypothetical protein
VTDVGAADFQPAAPIVFLSLAAGRLLLRSLPLRSQLLAPYLPQLAQLSVQPMPQRTLRPELFQEGLGPGKCLFVDLLIAKKGSPRPLDFIFGKQYVTS